MLISSLLLAISSSMDSLGIGITYGLKNIKLKKWSKFILFFVSIIITFISFLTGKFLKHIISVNFFRLLGPCILIIMGLIVFFKDNKEEHTFDLDNSNDIDKKEALILGIALSLDSFCIGIGAISLGINMLIFTIIVACFQYFFLSLGNFLGIHLTNYNKFSNTICTKISGVLLILIGIIKL